MSNVAWVFVLLVVFQCKHWLADYPLQRRWMLGKFRSDWGFVFPLLAHVAVHGFMTFWISAIALSALRSDFWNPQPVALLLAFFDMTIHFVMDRIKASPKYLGRYKTLTAETAKTATDAQWRSNDRFWWSMGFDQSIHHLTHYAIIWWLVTHGRVP